MGGEQPRGQTEVAQFAPRHPGAHLHLPRSQMPFSGALQFCGHVVLAQSGGAKPTRHSQRQARLARSHTQWPWPWQPRADGSDGSAHAERPQSSPAYPSEHTQPRCGLQRPWPEHLPGHTSGPTTSQRRPEKPWRHAHVPLTQSPRPEQSYAVGHSCGGEGGGGGDGGGGTPRGSAQASPPQPMAQTHVPPTQRPWFEQWDGHVSMSHAEPRQPRTHAHTIWSRAAPSSTIDTGGAPCASMAEERFAATARACRRGTHQPWPVQFSGQ